MNCSLVVREAEVLWDIPVGPEKIIVEQLEDVSVGAGYAFAKRTFDFLASLVLIILLLVPMVIIGLIIVLTSPGGAIYRQTRLGKNEVPFTLYKFRTMCADAEEDGLRWAVENDERTTVIGKWMRSTRMDELPQLFNILFGQMSFVGPRPERPEFYDLFDTYIEGFRQRMLVTPGLTGLAQVNGGYDLLPEEKIVYDIRYIKERSVRMDLICILKTFGVVLFHDGAR